MDKEHYLASLRADLAALAVADLNEPVWGWSGNNRIAHYFELVLPR